MDRFLNVLGFTLEVLDGVTYPLHYMGQRAWKIRAKRNRVRNIIIQRSDSEILVRSAEKPSIAFNEEFGTLYDMFRDFATKNPERDIMGHRECFEERMVKNEYGVEVLKYVLDDAYQWLNYKEVLNRIDQIAKGLIGFGINMGDHVALYANTCREWTMTFLALNKIGSVVVTIYPNLGLEGVKYAISHTCTKYVVTSQENLNVIRVILEPQADSKVIYFENRCAKKPSNLPTNIRGLELLIEVGKNVEVKLDVEIPMSKLVKERTALIMFTSGTTGNPKGVILTNGNVLAGVHAGTAHVKARLFSTNDLRNHCGIGYMPCAHIAGLLIEMFMLMNGMKIGYSSPYTLTDLSPRVLGGQKGDLSILKPTFITGVGLVLERLRKGINMEISQRGPGFIKVFHFCYNYKRKWLARGLDTPLLNKFLFKKFRLALGGHMEAMIFGASPISQDLIEFFRICVCPELIMAFGTTESSSCGTMGDPFDLAGESGTILPDFVLKLVDWDEGGVNTKDPEGPAGEILLSGPGVSKGYYLDDDDSLFTGHDGVTWYRSGDVGRLNPETGALTIIDRKKEFIKLQMGEYVSLAKVESALKSHSLVEAVCVYADPYQTSTLAIIVPNEKAIRDLARKVYPDEVKTDIMVEELCKDLMIKQEVFSILKSHSKGMLEPFETPKGVILEPEPWTPESGLVTVTMKLKRKAITSKYQDAIQEAYQEVRRNRK